MLKKIENVDKIDKIAKLAKIKINKKMEKIEKIVKIEKMKTIEKIEKMLKKTRILTRNPRWRRSFMTERNSFRLKCPSPSQSNSWKTTLTT